jgi:hypothetical protein
MFYQSKKLEGSWAGFDIIDASGISLLLGLSFPAFHR